MGGRASDAGNPRNHKSIFQPTTQKQTVELVDSENGSRPLPTGAPFKRKSKKIVVGSSLRGATVVNAHSNVGITTA